jgi:hypothetical protein
VKGPLLDPGLFKKVLGLDRYQPVLLGEDKRFVDDRFRGVDGGT